MDSAAINSGAGVSADRGWARLALGLGAAAILTVIFTWPTAPDMARIWFAASTFHHGFFVAPAALWMICAHSMQPAANNSSNTGLMIVIAAVLLWLVGRAGGAAIVEQLAFVSMLIGMISVIYGDDALRVWAWPLGFLFFMVPAGDSLLPALQLATAEMVVGALRLFGFDIAVDGIIIETRVGAFAIAEACAGLNLLIAAVVLSSFFAYVAIRRWTRRIAFIVFAALFAIGANAVRAFFLILFPVLIGKQADIGPDHYIIGWILYAAVLMALAVIGRRFADRESAPGTSFSSPPLRLLPVTFSAVVLAASAIYAARVIDRPVDRAAPATLSLLNAPGWRILPPPGDWPPATSSADRLAGAVYAADGAEIFVALSYYTHDRRDAEIAGASESKAESAWRRIGALQSVLYLFGGSEEREFVKMIGPDRRKYAIVTSYWLDHEIFSDPRAVKLAQAKLKLRGQNPEGGKIILAAPYADDPRDAVSDIGRFTAEIEKFADWRARL